MANVRFKLQSGREVSLSMFGTPGSPDTVLFCHPTAGAAGFDPDPIVTARNGAMIVGLNRPGYAGSDPLPPEETPSVQRFADDAAEYVRRSIALSQTESGNDRFGRVGVVGWSFGGCIALSFAARHPDLVRNVAIVGTSRPSRVRGGDPTLTSLELAPKARATSVVSMLGRLPESAPNSIAALGIDEDNIVLTRLGVRNRLQHMLDEAAAQNMVGVATDRVAARNTSWSKELANLTAKVLIVHGEADTVAGAADRRWFRRHIPGAQALSIQRAGHLAMVAAWDKILDHVTTDY